MRITVKDKNHRFSLLLPNILLINSWLLNEDSKFHQKYVKKHMEDGEHGEISFCLSGKAARRARRIIRKTRRKHPDWYLVDVQSSDGEIVKIKL